MIRYREQVEVGPSRRRGDVADFVRLVRAPVAATAAVRWPRLFRPRTRARYLIDGLESELYRSFYTQGRPVPVQPGAAPDGSIARWSRRCPGPTPEPAAGSRGGVSRGRRGTPGQRDGLRARVPISRVPRRGRPSSRGALVSVAVPRSARRARRGSTPPSATPSRAAGRGVEVRVYFNVSPAGAAPLVGAARACSTTRGSRSTSRWSTIPGASTAATRRSCTWTTAASSARASLADDRFGVPASPARRAAGVREAARPRRRRRRAPPQPRARASGAAAADWWPRARRRPRTRRAPARGSDRRRRPPLRGSRTRHRRPVSGALDPQDRYEL